MVSSGTDLREATGQGVARVRLGGFLDGRLEHRRPHRRQLAREREAQVDGDDVDDRGADGLDRMRIERRHADPLFVLVTQSAAERLVAEQHDHERNAMTTQRLRRGQHRRGHGGLRRDDDRQDRQGDGRTGVRGARATSSACAVRSHGCGAAGSGPSSERSRAACPSPSSTRSSSNGARALARMASRSTSRITRHKFVSLSDTPIEPPRYLLCPACVPNRSRSTDGVAPARSPRRPVRLLR